MNRAGVSDSAGRFPEWLQPFGRAVLKTEEIRGNMIIQLQEILEITCNNSNQAKKIGERCEWLRMTAYITQCTNTLLRDIELDELEDGMKQIIEHDRVRDEEEQPRRAASQYRNAPQAKSVKKDENQNTLPENKHPHGTLRETSNSDNSASFNSED